MCAGPPNAGAPSDETIRAFRTPRHPLQQRRCFSMRTIPSDCCEQEWDEQIDINLKGTFLMSKYALPGMIAQSTALSSTTVPDGASLAATQAVAYCASKGGVVLMTKAMAIDHGRQGHPRQLRLPRRCRDPDASRRRQAAGLEVG